MLLLILSLPFDGFSENVHVLFVLSVPLRVNTSSAVHGPLLRPPVVQYVIDHHDDILPLSLRLLGQDYLNRQGVDLQLSIGRISPIAPIQPT